MNDEIEIEIAQGSSDEADDILRCLRTLFASRTGEQALDRNFGIDYSCLDQPEIAAHAMLTAELVEKVATYEPRCRVARVDWKSADPSDGKIKPKVVIEIV